MRMAQVSGCFAASPVPLSLLSLTTEISKQRASSCFCKKCFQKLRRGIATSQANLLKAKAASNQLITLNLARCSASDDYIFFHHITKIYAYQNGGDIVTTSMVRAVNIQGCLPEHLSHIWAGCFLLFKFTPSSAVVNLDVHDLLSFITKFVIPLANHSFASLSQCDPILDLLRQSTEALESVENHILGGATAEGTIPVCFCRSSTNSTLDANPFIYQDLAHLRATILDTRARFMLLRGQYEIGEQLCRRALNIN
ncbi:hypothetical protein KSP39_PZI024048 [Platanthera zijinensis]|uniref:Plant disease resistance WDH domain-containing protein n=1 Tax=Platanthera zijinensis TaxID=2320716 RepID=A0AAP0FU84_9ASPA